MQVIAKSKSVRISPRKVRLIADSIRNLSAQDALKALAVIKKRGAYSLEKTLKSAISNAVNNANSKKEILIIKNIDVSEGPALKRYKPSTRGRIHPYKKRSSHITITLTDDKSETRSKTQQKTETEDK